MWIPNQQNQKNVSLSQTLLFFLISLFLRYLCGFKPPKIKKRLYTLVCVLDVFGGLTVWQHDNNKKKKETTPCMGSLVGGSGELVV